jgi:hypothetical protein
MGSLCRYLAARDRRRGWMGTLLRLGSCPRCEVPHGIAVPFVVGHLAAGVQLQFLLRRDLRWRSGFSSTTNRFLHLRYVSCRIYQEA